MSTINYYTIAKNDYLYLNDARNSKAYNNIAIQSQQVIEKYLKHLVDCFCFEHEAAERTLKTHNIVALRNIAEECGIDLDLDTATLYILRDYYFTAKYPGNDYVIVKEEQAKKCIQFAEEVKSKVEKFIENKNYCIGCGGKLLSSGECPNSGCT